MIVADSKGKGRMMIILLFISVLIVVLMVTSKGILNKYYFYGSDNIHSQRAIERHLSNTYGENFVTVKKSCDVQREEKDYRYTVHYVMSDCSGLVFDAYEYGYGLRAHDGDFNGNDYYLVRDNLTGKRLENKLNKKIDLRKYRSWDRLADDEKVCDYTIVYNGQNEEEIAEVVSHIHIANKNLQGEAPVNCEITDADGNRLWIYGYQRFSEELKDAGINENSISDVQKYVDQKIKDIE